MERRRDKRERNREEGREGGEGDMEEEYKGRGRNN